MAQQQSAGSRRRQEARQRVQQENCMSGPQRLLRQLLPYQLVATVTGEYPVPPGSVGVLGTAGMDRRIDELADAQERARRRMATEGRTRD